MSVVEILPQQERSLKIGLIHFGATEYDGTPRQRERAAVTELLSKLTGGDTLSISHNADGKPFLTPETNVSISLSHTRGHAAIVLGNSGQSVGIDIEYRSDRVDRIAQRFIHPDEEAHTTLHRLLLWSAKETIYKLFSEQKLAFFDMIQQHADDKEIVIRNMKTAQDVSVKYLVHEDYVLTYAMEAAIGSAD